MNGKIALITGAANGIGLEIAKAMAEAGATVCLADLNAEQAEREAAAINQKGLSGLGIGCDVTDEAKVSQVIYWLVDRFGRLDILVNNAGTQYVSAIEAFPSEKFELLVKVMLTAPFYAIKHVFPIMKAQGYGRVINMASINGLVGFAGKAAYNSAKHGVIGLTKGVSIGRRSLWDYGQCGLSGVCRYAVG
ncbi:MAG TPA: SDR family NAD(P)-dependent oxidoreductase [Parapedobacter sp.]|uniref:SDR family NAD(P)-dependent oxidoreductase n=1 Tax=Parapedobacter sp. TaxID=1958893 RepID=UPI002B6DED61|nr:SDR family NAD(P)-dependent oxidoreductase [Parapedobacter sp.]HWK58480.1 SDR family NAD(P)-dependent oxidoreductase [Parapedobacter sp.]